MTTILFTLIVAGQVVLCPEVPDVTLDETCFVHEGNTYAIQETAYRQPGTKIDVRFTFLRDPDDPIPRFEINDLRVVE